MKNRIIDVQNIKITVSKEELDDYICITDIAKAKAGESRSADVVKNWLRNRNTLEFLGTWEMIYNPDFKVVEFDHFKSEAGLHTFVLSVAEWINKTNAIGLYVKRGKYGGTYAHKDIAFEFASAISPVFKLYLIKEFQRLKEEENNSEQKEWDAKRFLSKNNYLIQTDAVKRYLLPQMNYRENLQWLAYAEEADILNVALFGFTAKGITMAFEVSAEDQDRQLTLIDEDGNEELFEVLFTFHSDDNDKSYILLYPAAVEDDDEIEVQAFSYDADEDGDVTSSDLHEITSDAEWDMVQGVLNTFLEDDRLSGDDSAE